MRKKIKEIYRILTTPEDFYFGTEFSSQFLDDISFLLNPLNPKTINLAIYISFQFKYIYVQTPKVGCSTIKSSLQKLELLDHANILDHKFIHNRNYSPLLKPSQVQNLHLLFERPDFFKFCFVRNPYTRILSAYLDKIVRNKRAKIQILRRHRKSYFRKDRFVSFTEFVKIISKIPPEQKNSHWREQFYESMWSKINYDFVGNFEEIEDDLTKVLAHVSNGSFTNLSPKNHHGTNASSKLLDYYTQESLDLVNAIYLKDFEAFGYKIITKLPTSNDEWFQQLGRVSGT